MNEIDRHRRDAKKLIDRAKESLVRAVGSSFLADDKDTINRLKVALKALGMEVAP